MILLLNKSCSCHEIIAEAALSANASIERTAQAMLIGECEQFSSGYSVKNGGVTEMIGECIAPSILSNLYSFVSELIGECIGLQKIQPFDTDKTEVYEFVNVSELVINHGLNKFPDVSVVDQDGNECYISVDYISISQIRIYWNGLLTGKVFLN